MKLPSAEELARKCALYDMDRAKYIAEIEHAFGLVLEAAAELTEHSGGCPVSKIADAIRALKAQP